MPERRPSGRSCCSCSRRIRPSRAPAANTSRDVLSRPACSTRHAAAHRIQIERFAPGFAIAPGTRGDRRRPHRAAQRELCRGDIGSGVTTSAVFRAPTGADTQRRPRLYCARFDAARVGVHGMRINSRARPRLRFECCSRVVSPAQDQLKAARQGHTLRLMQSVLHRARRHAEMRGSSRRARWRTRARLRRLVPHAKARRDGVGYVAVGLDVTIGIPRWGFDSRIRIPQSRSLRWARARRAPPARPALGYAEQQERRSGIRHQAIQSSIASAGQIRVHLGQCSSLA